MDLPKPKFGNMQIIMEPVAVESMVRIMNRSSHPGARRMKNRVYSRNKQQIHEKTMKEIVRPKRVGRWFKVSTGRYAPASK